MPRDGVDRSCGTKLDAMVEYGDVKTNMTGPVCATTRAGCTRSTAVTRIEAMNEAAAPSSE
jgi:hypothetical protein